MPMGTVPQHPLPSPFVQMHSVPYTQHPGFDDKGKGKGKMGWNPVGPRPPLPALPPPGYAPAPNPQSAPAPSASQSSPENQMYGTFTTQAGYQPPLPTVPNLAAPVLSTAAPMNAPRGPVTATAPAGAPPLPVLTPEFLASVSYTHLTLPTIYSV